MSTTSRKLLAGILISLSLCAAAAAQAHSPRVMSVRPIVATGITGHEAARIRYQVRQHHHMQRRAGADGVISRYEHAILARDAAQVRRLIHVAGSN